MRISKAKRRKISATTAFGGIGSGSSQHQPGVGIHCLNGTDDGPGSHSFPTLPSSTRPAADNQVLASSLARSLSPHYVYLNVAVAAPLPQLTRGWARR